MHYEGRTKIAFRASAEVMCRLLELQSKCGPPSPCYTEIDFFNREMLPYLDLERISQLPSEQLVVAVFAVNTNLVVLSCLEGIAQERPEIEIAVAAEVEYSTSNEVAYCSYFSASGENTIHPNKFDDNFCNCKLIIPVSAMDYKGEKLNFNFADIPNIDDAALGYCKLHSMPEDVIFSIFFDDCWGVPLILRYDPKGTWNWISDERDYDKVEKQIEELEQEYESKFAFRDLLCCDRRIADFSFSSDKFLLHALKILCPDLGIRVEMMSGTPHLLDDEGNEYFLGSMLVANRNVSFWKVDWAFPEYADWIPF